MESQPRILVVGCGAIGGVIAAHLAELEHDVTVLTTNPAIAAALRERGLRVRGESPPAPSSPRSVLEALGSSVSPFDYVLLAVQPPQVEAAARSAQRWLKDSGRMVCFQNGLCEERVGAMVGTERVLGAVVAWGASMVEPGVYDRTSAGGFALGRLDGTSEPALDELAPRARSDRTGDA